ncbi:uncharacterized protein [Leptinotarsa decemlineata]|uniref:uncharacterized protein n=1 Tax=Leptinotarsa decemlineata TaxID=7539 RepID=UPI003D30467F
MADKLKRYKAWRTSALNEISSLQGIANLAKTNKSQHTLFKIRYAEIETLRDEFMKHHNNILVSLSSDPNFELDQENTSKETFLESYYDIRTIYADLFENSLQLNQTVENTNSISDNSRIRLPKMELRTFSGDYKEFPLFIDLFNNTVHNNGSLNDSEKINYLVSCLDGPPLALVKMHPLEGPSYATAYASLVKKYTNERFRATAHWNELENCSEVDCENPISFRHLLDVFSENLSELRKMGLPIDEWSFILVQMLIKRINPEMMRDFERIHCSTSIPKYMDLYSFLDKQCTAIEASAFSFTSKSNKSSDTSNKSSMNFRSKGKGNFSKNASFFAKTEKRISNNQCPLCQSKHLLYTCPKFLEKTVTDRYNLCKSLHRCFNCLSNMHDIRTCKSNVCCRWCNKRHHSLLCLMEKSTSSTPQTQTSTSNSTVGNTPAAQEVATVNCGCGFTKRNSVVMLATTRVEILSNRGNYHNFRALLDPGSQSTFITQKAFNNLGLPKYHLSLAVQGLGETKTVTSSGGVTLCIKPYRKTSPVFTTDAVILPKICEKLPSTNISIQKWPHISNIELADPNFNCPGQIDLLLGADIFPKILLGNHLKGGNGEPYALETVFGYVVMGQFNCDASPSLNSFFCKINYTSLENNIKKFWELESVPDVTCLSLEDKMAEDLYKMSTTRDQSGRFIVSLPFRDSPPVFSRSRCLAIRSFLALEKRLQKQPHIYKDYCSFMREYLDLNHMELISENKVPMKSYYIPHHCVIKPQSSTTKLRVVFNASARDPNELSLNDYLLTGPKLQRDIVTILLNFRIHKYTLCADVQKMYRMILITPDHQDYQRSKWIKPMTPVAPGTLVLIKDVTPPLQWTLGRITTLKPGSDGISRVAVVKTKNGTLTRPLVKLCPLPIEETN